MDSATIPNGQWTACFAARPFLFFDFAFGETVCPEEITQ
jgi:hypothetical protein